METLRRLRFVLDAPLTETRHDRAAPSTNQQSR